MKRTVEFRPVALTILFALTVTYVLCVAAGALFGWTMYQSWLPLMPGVTWPLSGGSFVLGLLWTIFYTLYGAAIIVFPYNYLVRAQQ